MKYRKYLLLALLFLVENRSDAQVNGTMKWMDPLTVGFPVLEGRAWQGASISGYDRLPVDAQNKVRADVWNLAHHSAGLYLKFQTNASEIVVRYVVGNHHEFAMPHMPATGVSGIDLYAIDHSGNWSWAPGHYSFGDTITYRFKSVEVDHQFRGMDIEFRLFLPLYNSVSWLQIGVDSSKTFSFLPLQQERPIVVYGTSIAQGGCASRPGLAWPAILQREEDRPVINLGFSGNGRLEEAVLTMIGEIDARIFVLDCLPNLTYGFADDSIAARIVAAVKLLRQTHPLTPILLTDHAGATASEVADTTRFNEYDHINRIAETTFAKLKRDGVQLLFLLTAKQIGIDGNSTVDGIHPNDIGMMHYADAYHHAIDTILNEYQGNNITEIPIVQSRDGYDWRGRHEAILQLNQKDPPANIILANSIIHYWGGIPESTIQRGAASWDKYFSATGLRNGGFGWDRIENVLWRVYHGELDGYDAKHIVIMIGTNNLTLNTDEEIIAGLRRLVRAVRFRQPKAALLLSGLFPRRDMEAHVKKLNGQIASLATVERIRFINPGIVLLGAGGKIDEQLFTDGLHPNAVGYEKLGAVIAPELSNK